MRGGKGHSTPGFPPSVHPRAPIPRSPALDPGGLPPKLLEAVETTPEEGTFALLPLKKALEGPEKAIIESALRANSWNRQTTADMLQINRTTLYKKMKRYGLEVDPSPSRRSLLSPQPS